MEGIGIVFEYDIPAESGLEEFEFLEGEVGDAPVGAMFDLAVLPKGGADESDGGLAVGLDLDVVGSHRKKMATINHISYCKSMKIIENVWLQMKS